MAPLHGQSENSDKCTIILLNVIDDVKQGGAIGLQAKYGNVKLVESFMKMREESAVRLMMSLAEMAHAYNIKIKSEIIQAQGRSLATVIVDYANQNDIDLVIIGAGDLFKLRYLLVGGSVTGRVIKKCTCPVLLVH